MTERTYADVETGTDTGPVVRSREDGESASESVISAVSEATGTDPLRMERLGDVVDPDALDALFLADSSWTDDSRGTQAGTVTFRFNGCDVAVHADGRTVVSPPPVSRP